MHTGPKVYHFILHARQTLSLLEEIVAAIKINFFILKMVDNRHEFGQQEQLLGEHATTGIKTRRLDITEAVLKAFYIFPL